MRTTPLRGVAASLLAGGLLAACVRESNSNSESTGTTATSNTPAPQPAAASQPAAKTPALPDKTPAVFRVKFKTTVGDIVLECHRDWAPQGADRFFELVKKDFFQEIAFFRVVPGFVAQFGIHGNPEEAGEWRGQTIPDDPVKQSNTRGMVSFATAGPNTRTTQMFINFSDNSRLDGSGFAPFAKVVEGMDAVDNIYKVGQRPQQREIQAAGNAYLKQNFPDLTYIKGAVYLGEAR